MSSDWLRDGGWVEMLIDADVTSPGRAGALVKGSHVTWTRYAHQVTALSLSILERMPIHDTRLSERRMGLNSYRSKPGAQSKVARCPNSNIAKRCMTWRCSCCALYVRFAQGTCFCTRSHGMKSQIGRSFSITITTVALSRCMCAT